MEQNIDQTELLKALYQENLSEVIQLKEERAALRLRVAELEANQKCDNCPVNGEAGDDSEMDK